MAKIISQFPHCDQRILHAPGVCAYCDQHPEWQELRSAWGIAFTGKTPELKGPQQMELPCPADFNRGANHTKWWGGNAARPNFEVAENSRLEDLQVVEALRPLPQVECKTICTYGSSCKLSGRCLAHDEDHPISEQEIFERGVAVGASKQAINDVVDGLDRAAAKVKKIASDPALRLGDLSKPPSDPPKKVATNGVTPGFEDKPAPGPVRPDGQNTSYWVLSEAERARGFVRPVRWSYKHVGIPGPKYELRELTPEEIERYRQYGYVKREDYPESMSPVTGRFWTQPQLDKINKGCGGVTTMGQAIAETYARDPSFYGSTFCVSCGTHLPVGEAGEFVWMDERGRETMERVGT